MFGSLAYDPVTGLPIVPDALPDVGAPLIPSGPVTPGTRFGNRLFGTGGEERVQTWPEKLVRSAVTLPGDVVSGEQAVLPLGVRREDYTDAAPAARGSAEGIFGNTMFTPQPWQPNDPAYERAQDTAGLAGGGMMFGRLAPSAEAAAAGSIRAPAPHPAVLLADSAAPGAPIAALEHAPKFYSGLERGFSLFEDAATTGAPLASPYHALIDQPAGAQPAAAYHAMLDPPPSGAYTAPHGPEAAPAAREAAAPPRGDGPGGAGGGDARLHEAAAAAARRAGTHQPLEGLPAKAMKIGDEYFVPGPIGKVRDVAAEYMANRETPSYHKPPTKYHPLDEEHSTAIARAFDEMPHAPDDPAVKASYDALINETQAQFEAIKKTGLKIEPIMPDMPDPYAANPRLAAKDVADNNHLWYFPTDSGFGSNPAAGIDMAKHPMMRKTGEKLGDRELLANDMFRIVHDYFGHLKEGYGFRAAGEDNAWRSHAAMYSDLARPAMTTETRGQNSWVNYGPHGEANRKALAADTKYADQKVGLMPEWTMRDRGSPEPIIAYHGTPYSFDKFDPAHIGAGEGNQAYGHGLYFAGHEPVSDWYRLQLSSRRDPLLKKYGLDTEQGAHLGIQLAGHKGDSAPVISALQEGLDRLLAERAAGRTDKATQNMISDREAKIAYLQDPERATGHVYQVALDHPPEKFLDWDKPIAYQPKEVQKLFKKEFGVPATSRRPIGDFYDNMVGARGQKWVSNALKETGVPGIRYLDQGSRGRGKGTHNYVTFDAPRLLKRYAVPGLIGTGGFGSLAPGEER